MPSSREVDISPGIATAGVLSSRLSLTPGLSKAFHNEATDDPKNLPAIFEGKAVMLDLTIFGSI